MKAIFSSHQSVKHLEYPGDEFIVKDHFKDALKRSSLAAQKLFLEAANFYGRRSGVRLISCLKFLITTSLQLGDLKAVGGMYTDISRFYDECYGQSRLPAPTRPGWSYIAPLLKAVNFTPAVVEQIYPASNLHMNVLNKDAIQQLSGLLMSDGCCRMLEGKIYCNPDMDFPFVAGFFERCIGVFGRPMMTPLNTMYSDLFNKVCMDLERLSWTGTELQVHYS